MMILTVFMISDKLNINKFKKLLIYLLSVLQSIFSEFYSNFVMMIDKFGQKSIDCSFFID